MTGSIAKTALPGQVYGRWTVIDEAEPMSCGNAVVRRVVCRCACGVERVVRPAHLRSGRSASCGCLHREICSETAVRHGGARTPIYIVWTAMLQRCDNPRNKAFKNYGGRGITVDERWRDFASFRADVEASHRPGLVLDRRDNDGPYGPDNFRWATPKESARNQRRTLLVTFEGAVTPLAVLAERRGLKYMTVYRRFRIRGEAIELALRALA